MVHAPCTGVNAPFPGVLNALGMDQQDLHESWVRVRDRIAQRHDGKGKGREVAWLAEKLKLRLPALSGHLNL